LFFFFFFFFVKIESLIEKKKFVESAMKGQTGILDIVNQEKFLNRTLLIYSVCSALTVAVPLIRPVRLAAIRPTF